MTTRPTFASVTDVPCGCNYLQRAADDPRIPIVFDVRTCEYQFTYQEPECEGLSTLVIYHCPFCGGAAPESKRDLLFAMIPQEEMERLIELLRPLRTVAAAINALGQPDRDDDAGRVHHFAETEGEPPTIEFSRELVYERLSGVADVWITERADGALRFSLQGKYLGDASA